MLFEKEIVERLNMWFEGKKASPLHIDIEPTSSCNLKCKFCWTRSKERVKNCRYERRLTNITPLERVWISYFNLLDPFEGGVWAMGYAKEYMNLSMSIGGERAKLLVKMQMAASGGNSQFKKPEDKRNFIERHFTKRGQEPKEDDINEL